MRNFIPTPHKRIRRKLSERFDLYLEDEFRTTCVNYKTDVKYKNNNLKYKDKINETRKLHSVLTYKMENGRLGCINRDRNAVYNIEKIFNHYLDYCRGENKTPRPKIFCRPKKKTP